MKKVAVFTGTRAEYGLLRPVIGLLFKSIVINPLICVTGAHLKEEFGNTVAEIESDNIKIAKKIDILKFGTDKQATAKTVGFAIEQFTAWLVEEKPDAVLLLGDRYEIFAAASAAAMLQIPIAHISGGDVTLGASDEFYRHCITKMAALHFPSCEDSAKRIIQLGEEKRRVHCVGGLGDENLRRLKLMGKAQLSKSLSLNLDTPFLLVTFHPETAGNASPCQQMQALLDALSQFDMTVIFTKANADAGGEEINQMLDEYCKQNINSFAFTSLGLLRYLSAMRHCAAVVGNSSSGVVETPTLKKPCVNIGNRQKGRIICNNVICCTADKQNIYKAIKNAISPSFANKAKNTVSPYYGGATSKKIVHILESFLSSSLYGKTKCFCDINATEEG